MLKQVEKDHYKFNRYMTKKRWCSIWHQLDEVISLEPSIVLEVGPGSGVFKAVAASFGLNVITLDIDSELDPDIIASVTSIPAKDRSFDVVCSFQVLEHLPFLVSLKALEEIARVADKNIIISLPDAEVRWVYSFYIPKIGEKTLCFKRPFSKKKEHLFDGEHYWELNKKGYDLNNVLTEMGKVTLGFKLMKTYRVPGNHYHRLFIYERI